MGDLFSLFWEVDPPPIPLNCAIPNQDYECRKDDSCGTIGNFLLWYFVIVFVLMFFSRASVWVGYLFFFILNNMFTVYQENFHKIHLLYFDETTFKSCLVLKRMQSYSAESGNMEKDEEENIKLQLSSFPEITTVNILEYVLPVCFFLLSLSQYISLHFSVFDLTWLALYCIYFHILLFKLNNILEVLL